MHPVLLTGLPNPSGSRRSGPCLPFRLAGVGGKPLHLRHLVGAGCARPDGMAGRSRLSKWQSQAAAALGSVGICRRPRGVRIRTLLYYPAQRAPICLQTKEGGELSGSRRSPTHKRSKTGSGRGWKPGLRVRLSASRQPGSRRHNMHRHWMLSAHIALALALCPMLPGAEEDGFKPIFDGKGLEGWDGDPKFWRVEDGAITGQTTKDNPTKSNTFIVWRDGATVDDFEIALEYRIVGGNSGIQYRSFEPEKWVLGGYQADIDASGRFTGILYGERDRGILANRGDKVVIGSDHKPKAAGKVGDSGEIGSKVRKEDWNEYRVIARGNRLVHQINGVTTMEATDEDPTGRRMRGVLGLQLHQGDPMKVQFRNIRMKRTPLESGKKVVLVAGRQSHGFGAHDHKAGCHLIAERLEASGLGIVSAVYHPGWPKDPTAFDNANAIVVYSDGGGGHPIASRIDEASKLAKKGVGLGFIHYGVEVEKGKVGDAFLDWTG